MHHTTSRYLIVILVAVATVTLLFSNVALAQQNYPNKPITMIVPFNAGGAVDVTIRIICEEAEKTLGQKILVINKAGGGATEGQGFVARSKPDGYALLAGSSSLVTNTLTKEVDYTVGSFDAIVLYNFDPEVMFVYAGEPYKSIEELIDHTKKEPLTSATSGHSTSHHLASLILENISGAKFKYIHTKGGTEAVPMVAGGHAKVLLGVWGESRNMVDQGKLRPLAVMSKMRDPRFAEVPTFKEKGWDIEYGAWRGIVAPKGTPPDIREKLFQAFKKALESSQVKEKFAKADYTIMIKGPNDFESFLKNDYEGVKKILDQLKAESSKQ
ncbi:MAG: tripartite tricarboxylate transporter substrate binding protein [Deltaproteobacteria bacterium]|nr:tripartite tricarboxylate transporter substrate binding protein [Deltaproteobacteria bacterium]